MDTTLIVAGHFPITYKKKPLPNKGGQALAEDAERL